MIDEKKINLLVENRKQEAMKKAVNFEFQFPNCKNDLEKIQCAFKEANGLWTEATSFEYEGDYDKAYDSLQLYVRLVLCEKLNRRAGRFQRFSDQTNKNLRIIQKRMETDVAGMRRNFSKQLIPRKTASAIPSFIHERNKEENGRIESNPPPPVFSRTTSSYPIIEDLESDHLFSKKQVVVNEGFEKISKDDFEQKVVAGDGNCAFRSLAQGIKDGELTLEEEGREAARLRKVVCKLLLNSKSKDLKNIGLTVEQLVTIDPDGKHSDFGSYVSGMFKNDFAGEIELILLAEELRVTIFVYKEEAKFYNLMAKYGNSQENSAFLLWRKGLTGEEGNHYNALLNRKA